MSALNELDPAAFERLVNDLLLAEFGPSGRFVPFATAAGRNDGGYDAAYDGVYRGHDAHWTVSAKRVGSGGVAALKARLSEDIRRRPDHRLWVVTNLSIGPDDPVHAWLRTAAPGSEILAREELDALLRKHRWVARHHGVGDGTGYDLFRPASTIARPALPPRGEEAVARVREALDSGASRVLVVGTIGSGLGDVVLALTHDLYHRPGSGRRLPVWVEAREPERMQALVSPTEIRPDEIAYTFLVPPSGVADPVARLLARLPGNQSIVVGLAPIQAELFSATPPPVRVDLLPLEPREMRDWVRQLAPTSREDQVTAVVALCGDQPHAAASLVLPDRGMGVLLDLASEAIARVLDASTNAGAAADALAWTLLLVPIRRLEADPPSTELVAVARLSGLGAPEVERIVSTATAEGLLEERPRGGWDERSLVLSAAVVRRVVHATAASRFQRGVGDLDEELAWRAARRLAQFTDLERPLLDALDVRIARVHDPEFAPAERALTDATEVARLSTRIAEAAADVAERATERVRDRVPFVSDPPSSDRAEAFLPRQFAGKIAELLAAVGWWNEHVSRALEGLIDLAAVATEVPLERIGKELADPVNPHAGHLDRVVEGLAERIERAASTCAELLAGVGATLLADAVEDRGSVGRTLYFGARPWNESNPDVPRRRELVVSLLLRLVRHEDAAIRKRGWEGLNGLWDEQIGFGDRPPPPDGVRELAVRVLDEAERTFRESGDWQDWTWAERVVLRYVGHELAETGRLAQAITAFRTDPDYQVWRLLVRRSSFLGDPSDAARAVEHGEGWKAVVDRMAEFRRGEATRPIAERAARQLTTVDAVLDLLRRAASARRASGHDWGDPDILADWIDLAPELFRELLLGRAWDQVPSDLRAWLLHAARRRFGEELARTLEGPVVSGMTLGAALQLARLLREPHTIAAEEAASLLPTLLRVLPLPSRAGALYSIADHPGPAARAQVARELAHWLQFDRSKPALADAVAIMRRLAARAGPGSTPHDPDAAVWTLVQELRYWPDDEERPVPRPLRATVDAEIGWAIIDSIERGALWGDRDALDRFVRAAIANDRPRWLDAVARCLEHGRGGLHLEVLSPAIGDVAHVRALLDRARASSGLAAWNRVLEPPIEALSSRDLLTLVTDELSQGHADEAWILFSYADPLDALEDQVYLEALARITRAATPERVGALVDHIALRLTARPYRVDDAGEIRGGQGRRWIEAARTRPPALASVMRRIGERIERIVRATQERIDDAS